MLAAGIGKGDEVITSPITFLASANCALYAGANVKLLVKEAHNCVINIAHKLGKSTEKFTKTEKSLSVG